MTENNGTERIQPFLQSLGEVWARQPGLRFGQLMLGFIETEGDPFYWEDDDFLKRLTEYANKNRRWIGEPNPRVGVFSFIGERIHHISGVWWDYLDESRLYAEYPIDEDEYWRRYCFGVPEYMEYGAGHFPCGRVTYNSDAGESDVWLDKCVNDEAHQAVICKAFHLKPKKVFWLEGGNGYYECASCKERR